MQKSTPGRRRILDCRKKADLCDRVAKGSSVADAAYHMDVSLRTVQREAKHDEDFHHQLRLAKRATPDPLVVMQQAARAHWRAAAWLLERTDPDNYGRRPASSASPAQYHAAVGQIMEAALGAVPAEHRSLVYEQMQGAAETAFDAIFPAHGRWGRRHAPQAPPTPLVDQALSESYRRPSLVRHVFDFDESRLDDATSAASRGIDPPGAFADAPASPLEPAPTTHPTPEPVEPPVAEATPPEASPSAPSPMAQKPPCSTIVRPALLTSPNHPDYDGNGAAPQTIARPDLGERSPQLPIPLNEFDNLDDEHAITALLQRLEAVSIDSRQLSLCCGRNWV